MSLLNILHISVVYLSNFINYFSLVSQYIFGVCCDFMCKIKTHSLNWNSEEKIALNHLSFWINLNFRKTKKFNQEQINWLPHEVNPMYKFKKMKNLKDPFHKSLTLCFFFLKSVHNECLQHNNTVISFQCNYFIKGKIGPKL